MTTLPVGGKEALAGNEELRDPPAPIPTTVDDSFPSKARVIFYRSTLFQILVVGLCAFTAPGIYLVNMLFLELTNIVISRYMVCDEWFRCRRISEP